MATIPFTVPDAQVDRVADAYGWGAPALMNGPIGAETKVQFIKRKIAADIKSRIGAYEASKLRDAIVVPVLDVT